MFHKCIVWSRLRRITYHCYTQIQESGGFENIMKEFRTLFGDCGKVMSIDNRKHAIRIRNCCAIFLFLTIKPKYDYRQLAVCRDF